MRKNKSAQRKAKLKARKQQTALHEKTLSVRLSCALEKLCEPILPEYIDDSREPDLIGRRIVWQLGQIAWNIVVTGHSELANEAFHHTSLDAGQQAAVRNVIASLIKRKCAEFPNQHTAIQDFSVVLIDGVPRVKARPGATFPALPPPVFDEPRNEPEMPFEIPPEAILSLRKGMKLTQIQFGEIFGVSPKKVSAWEHGRAVPVEEQQNKIRSLIQGLPHRSTPLKDGFEKQ